MKKQPTVKSLRNDSPWDVADRFGLSYSGDVNPVPHGGVFYESRNWARGFANAIRLEESEGVMHVELLTISKPRDMEAPLRHSGFEIIDEKTVSNDGDEVARVPELEIEACLSYWGGDVEQSHEFKSDNGEDWGNFPEFHIMRAVRDLFPHLAGE